MSFFILFLISSFSLSGRVPLICVCVHVRMCVCEWMCACVHKHVVYAYTVFQACGHASGTSTYYICHCLYHVTSIFCKQVSLLCLEGRTLLPLSLLFPSVSVTPFLLPSLYIYQPPTLSFVSHVPTFHHFFLTSFKS